jgi:hypothetical protein
VRYAPLRLGLLIRPRTRSPKRFLAYGAAQESNLPSRGLHDRTGFEDQLGHRAHAAPCADGSSANHSVSEEVVGPVAH